MEANKYQEFARKGILEYGKHKNQLIHFALGLAGETGEVCDDIKKREYHGADIKDEHIIEELGDVLWYIANLCNQLNVKMEDVMSLNIQKLKNRYKELYTDVVL